MFSSLTKTLSVILVSCVSLTSSAVEYTFRDTTLSDSERVENLLSELTLEEKISLLSTNLGVPRLGIPDCGHYEGLHGLALGGPAMWGGRTKDDSGKVIPNDSYTTIFPQQYGLGALWDEELIRKVYDLEAEEARYYKNMSGSRRNSLVMRSPNADLARDPRWGRTEESFGEDPYLTGRLTVAAVKGLQGDNPRYWKTASLMKHFLANSNEDGRDSTSSDFDTELFYRYYSYPFFKGITEGGSRAFMASYNAWNGIPMTAHPCLKEVTRDVWGNNGIICTDGGALKLLVEAHKAYPSLTEGAAAVVKAGVGQFLDQYKPYVAEALEKGILTEKDIDDAIRGNIYVALKLGLLDGDKGDNPYDSIGSGESYIPPFMREDSKALAREITAKSVVLLKNDADSVSDKRLLPLSADKLNKVAVIGKYADNIVQDWYSGTPSYEVTILDGLRNALPQAEIIYAYDNSMGEAVKAANEADVAIVCVGNHPYGTRTDWKFCPVPSDGREAVDRKSLMLPDEDLVKQIMKVNPNTVLVLVSSFPYAIEWSDEHVPAIVHITHCSQEQGNGVADVLLGKVNPAARTTQTWVRDITELPDIMDYDIRNGRTYMYYKGEPLYPFGHGLSYTDFDYKGIKSVKSDSDSIYVTVEVENTGKLDGEEVIQIYASSDKDDHRLVKRLCAFSREPFSAGEIRNVTLAIPKDYLKLTGIDKGKLRLLVGSSSSDIRLEKDVKI